jgi:hypothetical protein
MTVVNLEIRNIRTDGGTQPRAGLDDHTIQDYTEAVKNGANFPSVVVFYDGQHHWLADGFHRLASHKAAGKQRIYADVRQGTLRDAVLYSVGANATHGLRRSNDDKRRAVEMLLRDEEWVLWSDREIAKRCNVSHPLVAKLREELGIVTGNISSENGRKYITKHGTEAVMAPGNNTLTAVIRDRIIAELQTTNPAMLASRARVLSNGYLHVMRNYLHENGYKADDSTITTILIDLSQQWQMEVPPPPAPADNPTMPAINRLIATINGLDKAGIKQAVEGCQQMAKMGIMENSRPVWNQLEELICALRPN